MQLPSNFQDVVDEIKFYIEYGLQDWNDHLRKKILHHFKYYETDIHNPDCMLNVILFARMYDYPRMFEYIPYSNIMVLRMPPTFISCNDNNGSNPKDDGCQDTTEKMT